MPKLRSGTVSLLPHTPGHKTPHTNGVRKQTCLLMLESEGSHYKGRGYREAVNRGLQYNPFALEHLKKQFAK